MTTLLSICSVTALLALGFAATPARAQDRRPATTPDVSGTLIVLNKAEATASLLDRATGKEIVRLPTGEGPHEVAVTPDGRTAVVANYGVRRAPGHTLTVIDLPTKTVRTVIDLEKYFRPHGIEFLPGGERLAMTCEQNQKVVVVNITTGKVEAAIDTDARISHMLVLSPDAKRAYVANIGSGSMSVVDLEKNERVSTLETGEGAEGIDISPDGSEIWVSNRQADTISIIDTATLAITETLPCPSFPIRVKFTHDGTRVLVSNAKTGDVAIFEAKTRAPLGRIAMAEEAAADQDGRLFTGAGFEGPVPVGILIAPDDRLAYIANTNADIVTVLDLTSMTVAGRLTAGKEPDGLGLSALVIE